MSPDEQKSVDELIGDARTKLDRSPTMNVYLERRDGVTSEMIRAIAEVFIREGWKVTVGTADSGVNITRWPP